MQFGCAWYAIIHLGSVHWTPTPTHPAFIRENYLHRVAPPISFLEMFLKELMLEWYSMPCDFSMLGKLKRLHLTFSLLPECQHQSVRIHDPEVSTVWPTRNFSLTAHETVLVVFTQPWLSSLQTQHQFISGITLFNSFSVCFSHLSRVFSVRY